MKKGLLIVAPLAASIGYGQTVTFPINFESSSIETPDFINFDGGIGTGVFNPLVSGINTSTSVSSVVRSGVSAVEGT